MLPATLLSTVEAHLCFTGCYRSESPVAVCLDAAAPLETAIQVSCSDCLTYCTGALSRLLPSGSTAYSLAADLSAHMRNVRGYLWALSGYQTAGPGFWLAAVSLTQGLFLVDGSRNQSKKGTDAELLVEAFKHKLVPHQDPRLLDPALYSTDYVYLNFAAPLPPITCKNDVLTAPQCSLTPSPGSRRLALLEFLPPSAAVPVALAGGGAATSTGTAASTGTGASAGTSQALAAPSGAASPGGASVSGKAPAPRKLQLGEVCPVCNAEFKERPLFTGSFVGCLC